MNDATIRDRALQRNSLATVQSGSFRSLSHLQDLQLYYNNLTSMPGDLFDPLTSINNSM